MAMTWRYRARRCSASGRLGSSRHNLNPCSTTWPMQRGELSHGVGLDHPAREPDPLPAVLVARVLPDKATTTRPTPPALFALSTSSMTSHLRRTAPGTALFLSSQHHHC